jgi:hypothetical protein
MEQADASVAVETHIEKIARVVIEVPVVEGDSHEVVLSKAWAILAEKITEHKKVIEELIPAAAADETQSPAPGNASWWNG